MSFEVGLKVEERKDSVKVAGAALNKTKSNLVTRRID
jgi:hypothetical protein